MVTLYTYFLSMWLQVHVGQFACGSIMVFLVKCKYTEVLLMICSSEFIESHEVQCKLKPPHSNVT